MQALKPIVGQNPQGAAQVQEFHRQLFANSSQAMRDEIKDALDRAKVAA